ncbi:20S proteasome subunit beta 5 [Fonticula alba]|uniref:Proteasome subunit beta n=1 Tax=Fonticula alba TaxID=691883 RepID=A0A058Z580_FONAL|nr:20S proteasome subunit beta 5 [Fonticula alba]KCV69424.1 20S proteasome subunit beta 5 [Fonticula alba]|eukprot:XP_009495989.1 20S proteasome subunit beta 5 [Fonticula alba]
MDFLVPKSTLYDSNDPMNEMFEREVLGLPSAVSSGPAAARMDFAVPAGVHPADFVEPYMAPCTAAAGYTDPRIHMEHGTTTLAVKVKAGVVVAVDSRATGGAYIASSDVKKVIEINPFLLGTMAGGAADCAYWQRHLGRLCRHYELRNQERISVAAASKLLANIVYEYKGMGLSMGTMITGWDKNGPGLYYVDSDGTRLTNNYFSVGSGSTYAYGVLDSQLTGPDQPIEEVIDIARRAITFATYRDAYSGGNVHVYWVKEDGWVHVSSDDVSQCWYRYQALRNATPAADKPVDAEMATA